MIPPLSRRTVLKLGTATGLSGLSGCTSMFENQPELRIRNNTAEKRAIVVRLGSAITGETLIDDEFRILPGGPHIIAKEVFPSTGEYDVCAVTEGISEQCETWTVEQNHPQYHVTLNPPAEDTHIHFTMGRYD